MSTEVQQPAIQTTVAPRAITKPRLTSLDVFRGMTIAAMILVNDAGDWKHIYWPLEHAEWNGWTPTDLIFPFFLFIVGVSMVLSFDSRQAKGASRGKQGTGCRTAAMWIGLLPTGVPRLRASHWP